VWIGLEMTQAELNLVVDQSRLGSNELKNESRLISKLAREPTQLASCTLINVITLYVLGVIIRDTRITPLTNALRETRT
jgi:hypothetical protein